MFNPGFWLRRLLTHSCVTDCGRIDPERLSLRDWADLPVHHPRRDPAPDRDRWRNGARVLRKE